MTKRVNDAESAYKFRKFCKDRGLTAKRVAEITGLSISSVYQYYTGTRYPSRFTKALLSEKLECDMNQIFN